VQQPCCPCEHTSRSTPPHLPDLPPLQPRTSGHPRLRPHRLVLPRAHRAYAASPSRTSVTPSSSFPHPALCRLSTTSTTPPLSSIRIPSLLGSWLHTLVGVDGAGRGNLNETLLSIATERVCPTPSIVQGPTCHFERSHRRLRPSFVGAGPDTCQRWRAGAKKFFGSRHATARAASAM